jgi:Tol biopolymer transport system component
MSWSRDGRFMLIARGNYQGSQVAGSLWRLRLSDRSLQPVLPASQRIAFASQSPDGRWIAFSNYTTGRSEIVVIPAAGEGAAPDVTTRQWTVSSDGGDKPVWRADSRELYYMRPDGMLMAVQVEGSGGEFRSKEAPLFQAFQRGGVHSFDAAPDGQHFLVAVAGSEGGTPLAVVTDWTRALRRKN